MSAPTPALLSPAELNDYRRHPAPHPLEYRDVQGLISHIDALQSQLSTIQATAEAGVPVLERYDVTIVFDDNRFVGLETRPQLGGPHTDANVAIAHLKNARQAAVLYKGLVEEAAHTVQELATHLSNADADLAAAQTEVARLRAALSLQPSTQSPTTNPLLDDEANEIQSEMDSQMGDS